MFTEIALTLPAWLLFAFAAIGFVVVLVLAVVFLLIMLAWISGARRNAAENRRLEEMSQLRRMAGVVDRPAEAKPAPPAVATNPT